MELNKITLIVLSTALFSCRTYKPVGPFVSPKVQEAIDYRDLKNWAAHPAKTDPSDETPEKHALKKDLKADVFFLHPTTYTGEKGQNKWNAPFSDPKLNDKTDKGSILFQSSAWNHCGRIFAPYYRQAHINVYFTDDKSSAKQALDYAYQDIKSSFEQFLKLSGDRPIIIASHSQGSTHAERLIEEYFDGKPLRNRLVAAYLIGMPVRKNRFQTIFPCEDEDDINCTISWRTFKKGYLPVLDKEASDILVTNPLSWKVDETEISKESNPGSLLYDFYNLRTSIVGAQIHKSILWANKPKFRGGFLLRTKNYHVADINFYYESIRRNAVLRTEMFIRK